MTEALPYLLPLFFITAAFYSMAGFGGGSTYLALLVLFAIPYALIPTVALACNLVVVSSACLIFFRAGHFSFRKVFPFLLTSIPAAYLGGRVPIDKTLFLWFLSLSLLAAGFHLLFSNSTRERHKDLSWQQAWMVGLPLGVLLGGISGLVGIGGGIFLAPLLYFLGWGSPKEIAAAASFFILMNSAAGLFGQLAKSAWTVEWRFLLPLAGSVFLGGQIGSRIGAGKVPKVLLQRLTAVLILSVSIRILWKQINGMF